MTSTLSDLISDDVGIISSVDDGTVGWLTPRLHPAYATVCDTSVFGVGLDAKSGGLAGTRSLARAAATGEAIERYSASLVPHSRLHFTRFDDLPGAVRVPGGHPSDLRRAQHWTPATYLGDGSPAWVPACKAYLSPIDSGLGVDVATSTGLACHSDPWQALRSALYEVIERDAVMVTWLSRTACDRIRRPERQFPSRAGKSRENSHIQEQYVSYLLPSPTGIPVVLSVACGGDGQPGAAVGAAARLSIESAIDKSLVEANQTFRWAVGMMASQRSTSSDDRPPPLLRTSEVHDLEDHVRYYLDPARKHAFDFLTASDTQTVSLLPPDRTTSSAEGDVRLIVSLLDAVGLPAYVVDVTSPDAREVGAWVVRAIVPGLYPLEVVHGRHTIDHPRLGGFEFNDDPHPFP